MNKQDCFNKESFNILKKQIIKNNVEIKLHERLIADKETIAKELSLHNRYIELLKYESAYKIIVIDKENKIPPYFCVIEGDSLKMAAYNSRFDTNKDIENRRNDWCEIIGLSSSKE